MMKTLFLHPPSFDGFDGGAGSRYQAKREIRSFWYPTWLAQPAALVPGSKLIDAPPAKLKLADVLPVSGEYELAVRYHPRMAVYRNNYGIALDRTGRRREAFDRDVRAVRRPARYSAQRHEEFAVECERQDVLVGS